MALAERQITVREKDSRLTREELIMAYLPHVKRIVQRIAIHLPPGVDVEDLENVGVIGLIQAVERYDPSRENNFTEPKYR